MSVRGCVRGAVLLGTAVGFALSGDAGATEPLRIGGLEVRGSGPSYIDLGIGVFDVLGESRENRNRSAAGRVEFRWGEKLFFIGPAIGVMANTDGGVYGYVGLYADIAYDRFIITPSGGVGAYYRGNSKDLGGTLEFRIGIGLAYEFQDQSRLGLRLDHMSNARLHDENPGQEEVLVTYTIPLSNLFGGRLSEPRR